VVRKPSPLPPSRCIRLFRDGHCVVGRCASGSYRLSSDSDLAVGTPQQVSFTASAGAAAAERDGCLDRTRAPKTPYCIGRNYRHAARLRLRLLHRRPRRQQAAWTSPPITDPHVARTGLNPSETTLTADHCNLGDLCLLRTSARRRQGGWRTPLSVHLTIAGASPQCHLCRD